MQKKGFKMKRREFISTTAVSGAGLALAGMGLNAEQKPPTTISVGVITHGIPKIHTAGMWWHTQGAHLPHYFRALANIPEVGAVALADPSGLTFAEAKRLLGSKLKRTHKDGGAMLRDFKPTMALVTLEAALSPPAIDAALEAGCHVLAEKPACVRAEDFEPLVRKAEKKNRHLMLALSNRLIAPVQEARRLVRSGKLGKLYGLETHIIADQTRLTRDAYRKTWICIKARSGGGHLIWLGIHWLDLALYITGESIEQVAGFAGVVGGQPIDVEDSAAVAMRFSNGAFGTMTSGYYLDKGYHSHLKVWGEHGWLRLSAAENLPLEWYSTHDTSSPEVKRLEYPESKRGYEPFVQACIRASAGLQEAPISGPESLRVLKTIFTFYRAAETGRTQTVA